MKKMKWFSFSLVLILLVPLLSISPSLAETELGGGRISLIQGRVLLQTGDEGEWTEASLNFPIADGDRIVTEWDGRVELHLKDGTYVRMGEGSTLDIITLSFEGAKSFIHLYLLEGKIYVHRNPTQREVPSLYIDLPYGVLSSHIPTRFKVDLNTSEAKISVLQGSVEWKGEGRPIPLSQGKSLIVRAEGHTVVGGLYGRDEWDHWNEVRDNEIFNKRYAQKYLPLELEPWGYEIEPYGRWVYVQEYRYVWVPIVSVGWAPFRYGHWAWRKGVYCWVPREPWGWVPFHYGRWIYLPHYGWVWVPPVPRVIFWHPGAVAWHIGPNHVSWVPLAPGEIYYGYRYYGPYSVNLHRSNITIQRGVFINAKVKDAVVTIPKDSFFKRHPVEKVELKENPFLHSVKISGPPTEKPLPQEKPKIPFRDKREFPDRPKTDIKTEVNPSTKMATRELPSVQKGIMRFEQKQPQPSMEKRSSNDPIQNRGERLAPVPQKNPLIQGGIEKRNPLPSPIGEKVEFEKPTTKSNLPKAKEGVTVHLPPVTQRAQEPRPSKEPLGEHIAKNQVSLSNGITRGNSNSTFPPIKDRLDQNSPNLERREPRDSTPFPMGEKWKGEASNSLLEGQKVNGSNVNLQKRVETFTPAPRREKVGGGFIQGSRQLSIPIPSKER